MHTNVFSRPVRPAALLSVTALAIGVALAAGPASAVPAQENSGSTGKATAVAARADLNVSVKGVGNVPVKKSLNNLSAPGDAQQTLLTAEVNGVSKGQPTTLVKAEVAHSSVKADAHRSVGNVKLVGVRAFAAGLPAKPLLSADLLTATASCEAGKKPTAKAALADNVTVLGKPVTVKASGEQHVEVAGVGTVDLWLENATTTDSMGTATALRLKYAVSPAKLDVVKTSGEIVLAEATCTLPNGSASAGGGGSNGDGSNGDGSNGGGSNGDGSNGDGSNGGGSNGGGSNGDGSNGGGSNGDGSGSGVGEGSSSDDRSSGESAGSRGDENADSAGSQVSTQTGEDGGNLAETGGNSATPVIAGVGGALVLGGAAAVYMVRRRRTTQNN
ncbi:choice-of-anchor P family protein [Streptomyces sp. SudanB52_2052]|uniref:choice-of-anchor P family protein n=1 Tax=Streptomyces sp. SudanB52_2052 TaxID=3035276 RepID=UPI003F57CC9F